MYKGIGKKIKNWVEIATWIGIFLDVVVGIILIVAGLSDEEPGLLFTGLVIAVVGPFFFPFIFAIIYGFGELVDRVCVIEERLNTTQNNKVVESTTEKVTEMRKIKEGGWRCSECNKINASYIGTCSCGNCKKD